MEFKTATVVSSSLLLKITEANERGSGLLRRLYLLRLQLSLDSEDRPLPLTSSEYQKVRVKLDRSFPTETIDFAKFPGSEAFVQKADEIKNALTDIAMVIQNVHEFASNALQLLLTAANGLQMFRLEQNRLLLHGYLDLLCSYMRVLMLFNSIPDRGLIFAMFCTSCLVSTGTPYPALLDIHATIVNTDKLMQFFFKSLQPCTTNLSALLMLLSDSIAACDDCQFLRQEHVLDIGGDGDIYRGIDGIPSPPMVTGTTAVPLLSELVYASTKYKDYVIFAFLGCPEMLLDPTLLELFQRVASRSLVVTVFRNVTLSIHPEFETLGTQYMSWKVLGKEKCQKTLRHVAKTAVLTCGLVMRQRRAFLLSELISINGLLRLEPGLVAPKLPQILATMALAKSELTAFISHSDVVKDTLRRDTRKHYHPNRYIGTDVAPLLSHLCELIATVQKQEETGVIKRYYAEQLILNDLPALETLCDRCSDHVPSIGSLLDAIVTDLKEYSVETGRDAESEGVVHRTRMTTTEAMMRNNPIDKGLLDDTGTATATAESVDLDTDQTSPPPPPPPPPPPLHS